TPHALPAFPTRRAADQEPPPHGEEADTSSASALVPSRPGGCRGSRRPMLRLAHLAQEDSRLPATRDTVGSLTRVVHELTSRLARRWPVVVYSARHETTDRAEDAHGGIRYVRFFPEPDRTFGAGWF